MNNNSKLMAGGKNNREQNSVQKGNDSKSENINKNNNNKDGS